MTERSGKRKPREQLIKRRIPELGYYLIITDANETEQNYMLSLRDSIPKELQGKLVIKVFKTKTKELVDEALSLASMQPQYGEPWIIFDRDQVKDFDQIIEAADKKGINIGWSNPCFEIWLGAYFGNMPVCLDSASCCNRFEEVYYRSTGHVYRKTDKDVYSKLCRFGNEGTAIGLASKKLLEHFRDGKTKPSNMSPATTVHILVEEIKNKIEKS